MFATLKNKIKEETGDDVVQSANQRYPGNNNNNYRLRSRRVSINSNSADDVGGGGFYNEVNWAKKKQSICVYLHIKQKYG